MLYFKVHEPMFMQNEILTGQSFWMNLSTVSRTVTTKLGLGNLMTRVVPHCGHCTSPKM